MNKPRSFNLFVLAYLERSTEKRICEFFCDTGVPMEAIQKGMHLTIYHSQVPLLSDIPEQSRISVIANVDETRFMVMAPGGENSKPNLAPTRRSVGIRLTKRNSAIPEIIQFRRNAYKLEPEFRARKNTSDWTNAFGARHFQPHIKLLRPGNGLDHNLTEIGKKFREHFDELKFSKIAVKV